MLRTLHRYRIVFFVVISFASIMLAFSGYVHYFFSGSKEPRAAVVNNKIISLDKFQSGRRQMDQLYRSIYGQNYYQALQEQKIDLGQQVVDRLVEEELLNQAAKAQGLVVSDEALTRELHSQLAGSPNAAAQYRYFLDQMGMSAEQFENQMREALARTQLQKLVFDASIASEREARASLQIEETNYNVTSVSITPDALLPSIKAPSEESVKSYFDENSSDFELPARVAYNFIAFNPANFLDLVEVSQDDIEFFYGENQSRFMNPEQLKVRVLSLSFADHSSSKKDKTPEVNPLQKQVFQKRAEEAAEKLKGGADFATVAKEYSTDPNAANNGGDLGFLTREALNKELDSKVATALSSLKTGTPSTVIEGNDAFYIVQIDEVKEATPKEITEVKAEIEKEIRQREAPAYTANKTFELLEEWKKSGKSLEEFVDSQKLTERGISLQSSKGLVTKDSDPVMQLGGKEIPLAGLSARVLDMPDEKAQLIDLTEYSALVEVTDFRAPEVSPFDSVKEKISDLLKKREAQQRSRDLAAQIIDDVKAGAQPSLEAAAKTHSLEAKKHEAINRKTNSGIFANKDLRTALFSLTDLNQVSDHAYSVDGSEIILQLTAATPPSAEKVQQGIEQAKAQEGTSLAQLVMDSMIKRIRAESKIDIEPNVLVQ